MITVVDRGNGLVIQKITGKNHKLIRYQVIPEEKIGDCAAVRPFAHLAEARNAIGKTNGGKPAAA